MKDRLYTILCAAALALCAPAVTAQVPPEVKAFQDAAGSGSVLFRGKQAKAYERPANGNPYWSSPNFVPGEVVFEDRFYDDVLVNIDAITGNVLVRKASSPLAIELPEASVSSVTAGDSRFERVADGVEGIPEGLYEVFGKGNERVYKHVSKRLLSREQNMNGAAIGYYDPGYRSDLHDYYAIFKTYYFKDRDGRFSRIRGKGALNRKFPERRSEIRKALSASGYDTQGIDFDDYCKLVLSIVAR